MKYSLGAAAVSILMITAPAWAQNSGSHNLNKLDKEFIKTTGASNLAEAALGSLAQQKAAAPAVKEFGRWMATDHGFANKRLMTIAKEAGDNQQPKLTEKDKAMQGQLEQASGAQFDRQYMQGMVQGHEKAVKSFKSEAQSGENKQLKTYAENLLPVLEQHLAEAKELAEHNGVASATESKATSGSSTPPRSSAARAIEPKPSYQQK